MFSLIRRRLYLGSSLTKESFNFPHTKITRLTNGLRVASQPMFTESATVGVWIDAGSRYETEDTNGTAHFLEHLIFKGTKNRSRLQLEQEIESMGAHLNAYTSREQTVYYLKLFKEDVKKGVEILADILQNSNLDKESVEQERNVILREMEEVEKSTEEVLFDRAHSSAFRDDSLGYTILGPVENIKSIQREDVQRYIAENYTADRMVIVGAGPIDHEELVKAVAEYFSEMKSGPGIKVYNKPHWSGGSLNMRNDQVGTKAYIIGSYEGIPWRSPDCITFMLMQQIIGSYNKNQEGMFLGVLSHNRTINNIANKSGVGCADSFTAFNTCYKDTGMFGFYAVCDEVAIEHCIGELLWGVTAMAHTITEEEVQRAKKQLKTLLFSSFEDTSGVAEDIGRQLLVYNRRMSPAEFIERLDHIDHNEVRRVAWQKVHDAEINLVAFGATHGYMGTVWWRKHTWWKRY